MSNAPYASGNTSNDLLQELVAKKADIAPNYQIIVQSAEDVQNIENAPAVAMGPYLIKCGNTALLRTISIYAARGESREEVRLLYMNAPAIRVWEEMGRAPKIIGARFRPPKTALLTFGVPFTE
jgi:hypothetical protein